VGRRHPLLPLAGRLRHRRYWTGRSIFTLGGWGGIDNGQTAIAWHRRRPSAQVELVVTAFFSAVLGVLVR
jgi:hypothetical protein